jgi:hypothetical protein
LLKGDFFYKSRGLSGEPFLAIDDVDALAQLGVLRHLGAVEAVNVGGCG